MDEALGFLSPGYRSTGDRICIGLCNQIPEFELYDGGELERGAGDCLSAGFGGDPVHRPLLRHISEVWQRRVPVYHSADGIQFYLMLHYPVRL